MDEKVKNALIDYEDIKLQIRILEEKLDPLKEIIFPFMAEHKDQKFSAPQGGNFEYKEKIIWKYSPEIETEEKRIKKMKADEVASGKAVKTFTSYFEYRSPKKEDAEDGLV